MGTTRGWAAIAACVGAVGLTACGGGGGDSSAGATSTAGATDAVLRSYLDSTNVNSSSFPWNGQFPGVVKRWNLPVPVKTNGEARAVVAMNTIEARLGFTVFDRTSIEATDEAAITRGLVFRKGTSYLPAGANPQAYCANVANAPFSGSWPTGFLRTPGEISARLYVNLDNPQCTASQDIAVHEVGHALGLGAHFAAFGDDAPITPDVWPVLATLYGNPIGTARAAIAIRRAN